MQQRMCGDYAAPGKLKADDSSHAFRVIGKTRGEEVAIIPWPSLLLSPEMKVATTLVRVFLKNDAHRGCQTDGN